MIENSVVSWPPCWVAVDADLDDVVGDLRIRRSAGQRQNETGRNRGCN